MHMLNTLRAGLILATMASPIMVKPLIAADAPTTNPAPTTDDALSVGLMYRDGTDGVAQDYGKAMTYFTKAADAGDTKAMIDIGDLYLHGQGVAQDYQQAKAYYLKAVAAHDWLDGGSI
jgi:hypothetical protein